MSKQYRVNTKLIHDAFELNEDDVVTLVEGSKEDDLYELPKHLHGKGHKGKIFDEHLNLKESNYTYIYEGHVEEMEERNES